jgi:hypothetical protein
VYFGDVHGRVFRYDIAAGGGAEVIANHGVNQPIGIPFVVAADKGGSTEFKPHIFIETGNDMRVPEDAGPFQMYSLRDTGTPAEEPFLEPFPAGYRGTVQPAGAFVEDSSSGTVEGTLVVFFVGTQFIPAVTQCFSQYNSIIYALEGATGDAAFDLPDEDGKAVIWEKEKITGIQTASGVVYVSRGIGAGASQPPPMEVVGLVEEEKNITVGPPGPGLAAPWTTTFKLGSSVCRQ